MKRIIISLFALMAIMAFSSCEKEKEDKHDYVDLGLSVKWATCNVGANKPEEYGDYYAWGETSTKESYYQFGIFFKNGGFMKYSTNELFAFNGITDNKTTLDLEDDVANAKWGGSWRMPTQAEFNELINNCTWNFTTQNGVYGYKVTSNKTGYTDKSIFLPVGGVHYDNKFEMEGSYGYYWSSSLSSNSDFYSYMLLLLYNGTYRVDTEDRYYGLSVRPVCP